MATPAAKALGAKVELRQLLTLAWEKNPKIKAAQEAVVQARAALDEKEAFFDPMLTGETRHDSGVEGIDQTWAQGGVEAALMPGVIATSTLRQTAFSSVPGDHGGDVGATALGVGLRVPLLKDRGFNLWRHDQEKALRDWQAAEHERQVVCHDLQRDIELRYLECIDAQVQGATAQAALARVEKLLQEAEELVSFKVVPEYQVYNPRMQVSIRRDDLAQQRQRLANNLRLLREVVGAGELPPLRDTWTADGIVAWAHAETAPPSLSELAIQEFTRKRPEWLALEAKIEAAGQELASRHEERLDELAVEGGGTLLGESEGGMIGTDSYLNPRHGGWTMALVWRRPWGRTGENARLRQASGKVAELEELQRSLEITMRTEMEEAMANLLDASRRLEEFSDAVHSAQLTLTAEEERFRLGEGRSRNVLDAQNDLNDVIRRLSAIAAERLRAVIRYRHAIGYADLATGVAAPANAQGKNL